MSWRFEDQRDVEASEQHLEVTVEAPRIRIGKRQTIKTLINEEALLLAKFVRNERKRWILRIAIGRAS